MRVLAVDPGVNGCGTALFADGRLASVSYVRNPLKVGSIAERAGAMGWAVASEGPEVDELALEWPRVWRESQRAGKTRGADPNDLLALAGVQAVVAARYASSGTPAVCVLPTDWKPPGMDKAPTEHRVRARLSLLEREVLDAADCPRSLMHNVVDAVGIGLHRVGRSLKR